MRKLKRYSVTVQFYVWANNDDEAKNEAENFASCQDAENDNKMKVYNIVYTPQGSMDQRLVYGAQTTEFKTT